MSDTHKHTWSVTYGQVVVSLLLGFGSLSKPQNKYEQNSRTGNQTYGRKSLFLAGLSTFRTEETKACKANLSLLTVSPFCHWLCLLSPLSPLICIRLYLFLYFSSLPPTLLVIPPCLFFSQFLPL